MAPSVDIQTTSEHNEIKLKGADAPLSGLIREPLKYSGSLDEYQHFNVTPVIGAEFPEVQLTDILNDDRKIKDLAVLGKFSPESMMEIPREVSNNVPSFPTGRGLFPQPEDQL